MKGRLDVIRQHWIDLAPRSWIETHFSREWRLTERQIRGYLLKVEREFQDLALAQRPARKAQITAAVEANYRRALEAGDLRVQLLALERLAKLDGLDDPDRLEVSDTHRDAVRRMTHAERMELWQQLQERMAARAADTQRSEPDGSPRSEESN